MTEQETITKRTSLESLLQEEEICRRHVQELLKDVSIYAAGFFEARRNGAGEVAARLKAEAEKTKAFAETRINHYRMHSDNLIGALQRDLDYIDSEKLSQFRPETLKALLTAREHRREILTD
jgi:hypothetical protein